MVWNYFGLRVNENGVVLQEMEDEPVCRTCKKSVRAKSGNTSNLLAHLWDHHADLYAEASKGVQSKGESSKQPSLRETLERSMLYSRHSAEATTINRAVAYFLAKDMQPVYTVEKSGFKFLVSKLNPRYSLPSRKNFTEVEIPKLYVEVRDTVVKTKLAEMEFFAATTDLWTSRAKHPYLSLTVHFLDPSWSLQAITLETVPLFEDHSGQNIAEALVDVLGNWCLELAKLVATTTDNGSNFIAAFNSLEWIRISCFGHNLDLAINKALNVEHVHRAVKGCCSLVEVFSRSWKKTRDFREKQVQLGLEEHKLIGDVATRWGSTYNIVSQIVEQQQAICAVLAEDRKDWHRMPSENEFSTLESLVEVLKPLSVFTDALSGENHVTVSALRPLLNHLLTNLLHVDLGSNGLINEMKDIIRRDLSTRYNSPEIAVLLDKCSFLDPRFKAEYLEDKEGTFEALTSEAAALADKTTPPTHEHEEETPPPAKRAKGLAAILKKVPMRSPIELTSHQRATKEIVAYSDLPLEETSRDPLDWWKQNSDRFPLLSVLVRKYLCICGTSVPSERAFSSGGYIVDPHRARLLPSNVNMLIFLSKNRP